MSFFGVNYTGVINNESSEFDLRGPDQVGLAIMVRIWPAGSHGQGFRGAKEA
jgi:hypothetical protein